MSHGTVGMVMRKTKKTAVEETRDIKGGAGYPNNSQKSRSRGFSGRGRSDEKVSERKRTYKRSKEKKDTEEGGKELSVGWENDSHDCYLVKRLT